MSIEKRLRNDASASADSAADAAPLNLSRRAFLQHSGGLAGGLVLGLQLGAGTALAAGGKTAATATTAAFAPNAFVRIGSDDRVTVIAKHLEMGQGSFTGLASLVAEELDADWAQVEVEAAPADVKRYANTLLGVQGTGGSTAMANSHQQMRQAGATARAMLLAAAAQRWRVPVDSLSVSAGVVQHAASGRRARFGELATAAGHLPVPTAVPLKDPAQFKLIGAQKLPRKDSAAKTDGSAVFTQDIKRPDMLVAVVAHPPRFGAKLKSFDASKAKAIPGVVDVVAHSGQDGKVFAGVAVLAKNTWIAKQGRDALQIEWDDTHAVRVSSAELFAQYHDLAAQPGTVAKTAGDAAATWNGAPANRRIDVEYRFPYLAHAAMEPMNCLVHLGKEQCEFWNGEQFQTPDQQALAQVLGLAPEKIQLHQLYAGGSFGRRANPHADYLVEAALIAQAARRQGHEVPIKMVWTREEDMHGGYYRPAYVHRVQAAVDAHGALLAWQQRIVGQSIFKGTLFESFGIKDGIDSASVEGALEPYPVPHARLELHSPDPGVPVLWWRSVGNTHTAYVNETVIDELAHTAGQDAYAFRRAALAAEPRHKGVLELAATQAGWERPLPPGAAGERRGRGIAVHKSFGTYVAQVAEITIGTDGQLRVDRVVCAVDCGLAINPDVIRAQMEGGIGYALAAALYSEISLADGVVEQANFDTYRPLRISEMPRIEVHIVASGENPSGVGEPGVPPLAPAVANAIFAATGQRIRKLPFPATFKA